MHQKQFWKKTHLSYKTNTISDYSTNYSEIQILKISKHGRGENVNNLLGSK